MLTAGCLFSLRLLQQSLTFREYGMIQEHHKVIWLWQKFTQLVMSNQEGEEFAGRSIVRKESGLSCFRLFEMSKLLLDVEIFLHTSNMC